MYCTSDFILNRCSNADLSTQAQDARIIIGSFSPSMALPIFCEVFFIDGKNIYVFYNRIKNFTLLLRFKQVHRRNLYGADHVSHFNSIVSVISQYYLFSIYSKIHAPPNKPKKVWLLPGSVFGSDHWLEQLLQQHSIETANGSCSGRLFSKKDLMAVIEGNFFMRPYSHPVNITEGNFESFDVSVVNFILPFN